MKIYKVYVADKFTKWPLFVCNIKALTRWGAKRKAFREVCQKDKTYLIIVSKP